MTDRRRVLVLNHFAAPRNQPGGTRHIELFSRLDGWDFTIIASRLNLSTGKPQADTPGFVFVPVIPYRSNGIARILNWCSYAVMAALVGLRGGRPDVIYASSPHLLAGAVGWLLSRVRRARFILEIRDLWPQTLVDMGHISDASMLYKFLRRLELSLYRRADIIVTMAPGTNEVLQALGIPLRRLVYIPNGADPGDFVPSEKREILRLRYGFDRLTGVYAGAHGPANGLEQLMQAAAEVRDLPVDIVLIGDGVHKRQLQTYVLALGLSNVRFMDPVPKAEIPDVLNASDFGIHVLADVEVFQRSVSPNKVFDYMAAGRSVLTNNQGYVADLIRGSNSGVAVEPAGLAQGIRAITTYNSEELRQFGRNGQIWIHKHHSRSCMTRVLGSTLLDLVTRRG